MHKHREVRFPQVVGGNVDGDTGWSALYRQLFPYFQGFPQHPAGERFDQAGLLGQFDHFMGRDLPLPVRPADQGLEAGNVSAFQALLGLQVQGQLVQLQCLPKLGHQGQPFGAVGILRRLVIGHTPFPGPFRTFGNDGSPDQGVHVRAMIGVDGHPQLGGERYLHAQEVNGLADNFDIPEYVAGYGFCAVSVTDQREGLRVQAGQVEVPALALFYGDNAGHLTGDIVELP